MIRTKVYEYDRKKTLGKGLDSAVPLETVDYLPEIIHLIQITTEN